MKTAGNASGRVLPPGRRSVAVPTTRLPPPSTSLLITSGLAERPARRFGRDWQVTRGPPSSSPGSAVGNVLASTPAVLGSIPHGVAVGNILASTHSTINTLVTVFAMRLIRQVKSSKIFHFLNRKWGDTGDRGKKGGEPNLN